MDNENGREAVQEPREPDPTELTVLNLGPGYRARGTQYCWQVEKYRPATEKCEERWEAFLWYSTLRSLLRGYCSYRLRTSGSIGGKLKYARSAECEALGVLQREVEAPDL